MYIFWFDFALTLWVIWLNISQILRIKIEKIENISIICNKESLDALDVSILLIFSCINHSFHVE